MLDVRMCLFIFIYIYIGLVSASDVNTSRPSIPSLCLCFEFERTHYEWQVFVYMCVSICTYVSMQSSKNCFFAKDISVPICGTMKAGIVGFITLESRVCHPR
jgi:hypothetical protein